MELSADALRHNLRSVRASVGPGVRLLPMVKADAYGTGVAGAVAALEADDPYGYGVAAVEEGVELRALGVLKPILVLSPTPPASVRAGVEAGLTLSISSLEALDLVLSAAAGGPAAFHLEVDTGMGRAGFDWRDTPRWAPRALQAHAAGVRWTGCFTHMHSADEGRPTVDLQWGRLQEALAAAGRPEGEFLVHGLNSAASLRCPEYAADLVRPGIFLYGGRVGSDQPSPEDVASVHARIVHVRSAPAGTTLGYGSTYRSGGDERWATVAMGYGDGLPRALGNRGHALVGGTRVPIVGRISMDVSVVDITHVAGVRPGDVATFIGSDGDERISVDEVAESVGTISYEILTGFTRRVARIWTDGSAEGGS
ncbi:MAG TPA: alanine racemase [Longimicrobiales bacterium]|nr:alanine racemase [Longimicrobiales bacterium]